MSVFKPYPKQEPKFKKQAAPIKRVRAETGELALFKQIHRELNGKSQITGKYLVFDVKNFAHIISKGARVDLRLNKENILHCEYEFHWLYDNRSKEAVLQRFPSSAWVFEKKQTLKSIPVEKN
jgi:hypothetical protein